MNMKVAYGEKFYSDMNDSNLSSARTVVPITLDLLGGVTSVVDVGCGRGLWLKAFLENKVTNIFGVDGDWVNQEDLVIPGNCFSTRKLDENFLVGKSADLAISLEVAEHVPESSADNFVLELTKTAPVILFSAAIPGQGGTNHLNEQWPSYWESKFKECGYVPIDALRRLIWNNKDVAFFYAQNTFFFVKESEVDKYPKLKGDLVNGFGECLPYVHPVLFERAVEDASRWKLVVPYVKYLPMSLIKYIKKILKG